MDAYNRITFLIDKIGIMKILCTIVLYNQQLYKSLSYTTGVSSFLKNKNVGLFIYDNSPIPQHDINDFFYSNGQIQYVSDTSNSGVSAAYNRAYEYAKSHNFQWLLLLDQDSTLTGYPFLQSYIDAVQSYPTACLFVPISKTASDLIISPIRLCFRIPLKRWDFRIGELNSIKNVGIINSGMFISVDAFEKVGGYNEEVFLDYSDYQFIERFASKYKSFYLLDTSLIQDFSNEERDVNKLSKRYSLLCESLRNYEVKSFWEKLNITFIVLKRAVSLFIRSKNVCFVKIFFLKYLRKYNGEKYIREQLESILPQLCENDEIIISDDSSTDNTLQIVQSFDDSRIKIFSNNKFHSPIFNFENALRKAKGDYIFLSDQDDIWKPDKVEVMMKYLKRDCDLVLSDGMIVDAHLNVLCTSIFNLLNSQKGFIRNLIHNSYSGSRMAFTRRVLGYVLPFPKKIAMHDIWIGLCAELFLKAEFISDSLILYRKHGDNVSVTGERSPFSLGYKIRYRVYIIIELIKRWVTLKRLKY